MKSLRWILLAALVAAWPAQAFWQSRDSNYNISIAGGGGTCSQATTFLARTSGLSTTESNAYIAMICGMVTDGTITGDLSTTGCGAIFDALYIFATKTTTIANLNLCSTSYGLTASGSPTFTADVGYTGNGTSATLLSTFHPSSAGGNWALNSASISAYVLTSRAVANNYTEIGTNGGAYAILDPYDSNGKFSPELNASNFMEINNANAQGQWIVTRVASSSVLVYGPHGSITPLGSVGSGSAALPTSAINVLSYGAQFTTDQLSAAWFGGGVTAAQAVAISSRINAFMTTMGVNVY